MVAQALGVLGLVALAALLEGCPATGPGATVPAHLSCKGKGTLVGSVSGFSGVNWAIDCGDGLIFDAGPDPLPPPAPAKTP